MRVVLATVLSCLAGCAPAVTVESVRGDVAALTAPAMRGRSVRTFGAALAATWIAARFKEIGLNPGGGHGGYFHQFELSQKGERLALANVVAVKPGADSGEVVVVGAHYDHLGLGDSGALGKIGEVHPGADDNASGVAALLAVATSLKSAPRLKRSVVFVAFSGEEKGLLGSAEFVKSVVPRLGKVTAMINMDMVGRLRNARVVALGAASGREVPAILAAEASAHGLDVQVSGGGYGPSDQTPFYGRGIPVMHVFTGAHYDYHKPTDTADRLNFDGIVRIARLVAAVARRVADIVSPPTFVRLKEPPPVAGRGYGAYLGTIPRFGFDGVGVEIDGVRDGSPAQGAGLKAGDVIRKLGAVDVASLEDLTRALRTTKPGTRVEIVYVRGAERIVMGVTLGERGK